MDAETILVAVLNFLCPDIWVALARFDVDMSLLGPSVCFNHDSIIVFNWLSSNLDTIAIVDKMVIHFHVSPSLRSATKASHFSPDFHVNIEKFFSVYCLEISFENLVVIKCSFIKETWSIWRRFVIMDKLFNVIYAFLFGDLSMMLEFIEDTVALMVFANSFTTLAGLTSGEIG